MIIDSKESEQNTRDYKIVKVWLVFDDSSGKPETTFYLPMGNQSEGEIMFV